MAHSFRAILLDFDGVIADSEPVHLRLFQKILSEEGMELREEEYYEKYLGLDDRSCFEAVFRDQGKPLIEDQQKELVRRKHQAFEQMSFLASLIYPGVVDFLERASPQHFLAIVSGALRDEVLAILRSGGIHEKFQTIVAAEDVTAGKPAPDGFLEAVRRLNRDAVPSSEYLLPQECLVIEDSPWGIEAARGAGMKCVALMTSYPREKLSKADLIFPSLKSVKWEQIESL